MMRESITWLFRCCLDRKVACPICLEIKVICFMNQIRSLLCHLRDKHHNQSAAIDAANRLDAWMENNFITEEELAKKAALPGGLISPTQMLSSPWVRTLLLTRDISWGHLRELSKNISYKLLFCINLHVCVKNTYTRYGLWYMYT